MTVPALRLCPLDTVQPYPLAPHDTLRRLCTGIWDEDGDGHLSRQEVERGLGRAVAHIDTDANGFLELEELLAALGDTASKGLARLMIQTLDRNRDGRVSLEELHSHSSKSCAGATPGSSRLSHST